MVYDFAVFADIPLVGVAADGFDEGFEHYGEDYSMGVLTNPLFFDRIMTKGRV
jgi:hypothetical protein